ncbi:MAG: hypothetical protein ACOC5F_04945 [Candidatus Aminicenantaceae bacterium]
MKVKKCLLTFLVLPLILIFSLTYCRNAVEEPLPTGPSAFSTVLELSTSPNVIFAGDQRETTTLTATLKKYTGIPIIGETLIFEVRDASGAKAYVGFFEDNQSILSKTTDQNGKVTAEYFGPLAGEILGDSFVYIYAFVAGDGKDIIYETTPVYIIQDVQEVTLSLSADPNVLLVTNVRPKSHVTAMFTKIDGTPIIGRKIFFTILKGPGEFKGHKTKTYMLTDSMGIATVTYIGPTNDELPHDRFVEIRAQPQTATPYYIHEEVKIRLNKN